MSIRSQRHWKYRSRICLSRISSTILLLWPLILLWTAFYQLRGMNSGFSLWRRLTTSWVRNKLTVGKVGTCHSRLNVSLHVLLPDLANHLESLSVSLGDKFFIPIPELRRVVAVPQSAFLLLQAFQLVLGHIPPAEWIFSVLAGIFQVQALPASNARAKNVQLGRSPTTARGLKPDTPTVANPCPAKLNIHITFIRLR